MIDFCPIYKESLGQFKMSQIEKSAVGKDLVKDILRAGGHVPPESLRK